MTASIAAAPAAFDYSALPIIGSRENCRPA